MLELADVHVRYGTTDAVRGIDLHVDDSEAVALLGPNGAGKTSTLRAISRLVPCAGRILFDGEDIGRMAPEDVARRGLIHVPEGRHVFGDLTVEENILIGRTARNGRSGGFELDDVFDLFPALVRLRGRLGYALSGGEQQMVVLGRGLAAAPRLLLVDEPSLGLAPLVANVVAGALEQVRSRMALLVVEQNVRLAARTTSRAAVLSSGRIVLESDSSSLLERDDLVASYLGQNVTGIG